MTTSTRRVLSLLVVAVALASASAPANAERTRSRPGHFLDPSGREVWAYGAESLKDLKATLAGFGLRTVVQEFTIRGPTGQNKTIVRYAPSEVARVIQGSPHVGRNPRLRDIIIAAVNNPRDHYGFWACRCGHRGQSVDRYDVDERAQVERMPAPRDQEPGDHNWLENLGRPGPEATVDAPRASAWLDQYAFGSLPQTPWRVPAADPIVPWDPGDVGITGRQFAAILQRNEPPRAPPVIHPPTPPEAFDAFMTVVTLPIGGGGRFIAPVGRQVVVKSAGPAAGNIVARAAPAVQSARTAFVPLPLRNPHVVYDAAAVLQNITDDVVLRLENDPSLLRRYLYPRQYNAAQRNPQRWGPAQFGNAVEAMVAEEIAGSPLHSRIFYHLGGRGRPDFIGVGPHYEGMMFDITTFRGVATHTARPQDYIYDGTAIIPYRRPPNLVFP